MLQRLPLQQFHDHEGLAVELANVVNGADVSMIQRLLVLGHRFGEELQGHVAAKPRVFRFVYYPHAATAESL